MHAFHPEVPGSNCLSAVAYLPSRGPHGWDGKGLAELDTNGGVNAYLGLDSFFSGVRPGGNGTVRVQARFSQRESSTTRREHMTSGWASDTRLPRGKPKESRDCFFTRSGAAYTFRNGNTSGRQRYLHCGTSYGIKMRGTDSATHSLGRLGTIYTEMGRYIRPDLRGTGSDKPKGKETSLFLCRRKANVIRCGRKSELAKLGNTSKKTKMVKLTVVQAHHGRRRSVVVRVLLHCSSVLLRMRALSLSFELTKPRSRQLPRNSKSGLPPHSPSPRTMPRARCSGTAEGRRSGIQNVRPPTPSPLNNNKHNQRQDSLTSCVSASIPDPASSHARL